MRPSSARGFVRFVTCAQRANERARVCALNAAALRVGRSHAQTADCSTGNARRKLQTGARASSITIGATTRPLSSRQRRLTRLVARGSRLGGGKKRPARGLRGRHCQGHCHCRPPPPRRLRAASGGRRLAAFRGPQLAGRLIGSCEAPDAAGFGPLIVLQRGGGARRGPARTRVRGSKRAGRASEKFAGESPRADRKARSRTAAPTPAGRPARSGQGRATGALWLGRCKCLASVWRRLACVSAAAAAERGPVGGRSALACSVATPNGKCEAPDAGRPGRRLASNWGPRGLLQCVCAGASSAVCGELATAELGSGE